MNEVVSRADQQLGQVLKLFESEGLRAWLDAGSLLGAVRQGSLLTWDNDIDFGCWEDQLPALRRVTVQLARRGYSIRLNHFRNKLYKVQYRPSALELRRSKRTVDVAVYRRHRGVAWSPVNCIQPQPHPRFSLRWFLEKPFREMVIYPWRRNTNRSVRTTTFPSLHLAVHTWVVPAAHFAVLQERLVDDLPVDIPCDVEAYLALRYGDWRTPTASWNYCIDDGSLVPLPPEQALADCPY